MQCHFAEPENGIIHCKKNICSLNPDLEPFNARWSSEKTARAKNPRSRRSLAATADASEDIQIVEQGPIDELPDPVTIDAPPPTNETADNQPVEWPIELSSAVDATSLDAASFHEIEENDEELVVRMTLNYDRYPRAGFSFDDESLDIWLPRYEHGIN